MAMLMFTTSYEFSSDGTGSVAMLYVIFTDWGLRKYSPNRMRRFTLVQAMEVPKYFTIQLNVVV